AGLAPLEPTGPVVEVQPRPPLRVTPLIETVEPPVAAEAPPPEPEPAAEPEPVSEPAASSPSPVSEPEEPSAGESYRQVAFAAAAGAAAAAAAGAYSHDAAEEVADEPEAAEAGDG